MLSALLSEGHVMPCPSPKAFGLQETLPGEDIPEEWRVLLAEQARTLAGMLHRVAQAVTTIHTRPDRKQERVQRLQRLLTEAERRLTALAQANLTLERQTAQFQALGAGPWGFLPEAATRLHIIEQVNGALHANLAAARQFLSDTRKHIETKGERPA